MINSTKGEENHIYEAVDQRPAGIVAELDEERLEEYWEFREKIAQERCLERERKGWINKESEAEPDTDIDPPTPQRVETVFPEGRRIYSRPTSETYHLEGKCEGEASEYGRAYEEKKPCRACKEETEDTLGSRYGSKALGFIRGSEVYDDDWCLIWVSHKIVVNIYLRLKQKINVEIVV